MRWFSFITLFCFVCFTTSVMAQTVVKVISPKANIRSGPGIKYKVIDGAKKDELLKFIEKKGEWVKVGLKGGRKGWISEKLVSIVSAKILRVKVGRENLRKAPGGEKIGELLKDTELKVIETEGRWAKVEVVGWIWRDSTMANKIPLRQSVGESKEAGKKIKGGFSYKNVKLKKSMGMVKVMGEMTNHSGKDFQTMSFIISFYDHKGRLLETGDILINNFSKGQTKLFTAYIENVKNEDINGYKIQFDFGI